MTSNRNVNASERGASYMFDGGFIHLDFLTGKIKVCLRERDCRTYQRHVDSEGSQFTTAEFKIEAFGWELQDFLRKYMRDDNPQGTLDF